MSAGGRVATLLLLPLLCDAFAPIGRAPRPLASRAAAPTMMPIGVPKVAYRVPGSEYADWVDLYNRLFRERILFLGGQINDEIANQMIGIMLYLDSEDNTKPVYMYINSPGGSVTSGFAMFDTIRHIKSDVSTINVGLAASMASFLLVGGTKGKRLALPHSRVMIHQPQGKMQGQASDIQVEAEHVLSIRERMIGYYSTLSGQPREKVALDMDRDKYMSAQQALEYGIIDRVIKPQEQKELILPKDGLA